MLKLWAAEVPPPGAGVLTVTDAVPAAMTSAAAMGVVSWVALTNVVVRSVPFQRTFDALVKLAPLTVSVKAVLPIDALAGESEESVGAGLVIEKLCAAEVPPPGVGVLTVTEAVPPLATSLAGMAAVSCVALTNVVVRSALFQRTFEPLTKPVPLTVSVKATAPGAALEGDRLDTVGAGLLTAKDWAPEVPLPVSTVICAVPAPARSVAGIEAVSCVALTNVVVRAAPFQRTVAVLVKLVPLTVRVKAAPPTRALVGETLEIVGPPTVTGKLCALDVPPPGVGFATVIEAVVAAAMSAAVMAAVSCVALTNVVVRSAPFQRTFEPLTKLAPATVRVKAGPPTVALDGDSDVSVGDGFPIENVRAAEVPPPGVGLFTVIDAEPAAVMSAAVMAAVSCVALTNVVVRVAVFQRTVAPLTKPVPLTVRVKAGPPTVALDGDSDASVGTGLLFVICSCCADELPPPGLGVLTVIATELGFAMSAAVMAAVSRVELTNVVVRSELLSCTFDAGTKPVPFTVSVKAGPPAETLEGDSDEIDGDGLLTENVWADEVPPPGVGVLTVTGTEAPDAMSEALIDAVSWVLLTKVVVFATLFHCTVEPLTKPVPVAVSVKAAPPADALLGESEVSVGAGLLAAVPVPVTVRWRLSPPEVNVTLAVTPAALVGENRTVAVVEAPAARLNEPPDCTVNGEDAVTLPVIALLLVFWIVNV
jgi:hypothetical protein